LRRSLSLATRLALVFGGLFVLTSGASALLAAARAGADAEEGFRRNMSTLVRVMPAGTGAGPQELKRAMGVDVAGFLPTGTTSRMISSLNPERQEALRRILSAEGAARRFVPGPVAVELVGERYQVFGAWRGEPGEPGMEKAKAHLAMLLVPQEEFDRVRTAAVGPIMWGALAGAGAAVLLAGLLARSISRPVRRLAAGAGRVAEGQLEFQHVRGGGRELEELSESLESMTAALARSRDELVRSERAAAAGQMAAALAHEVRNPLTGAKMTLEMLLAEEKRESVSEELRAVHQELQRLQMVVDELVSFARPAPAVFAAVELAEVAGEVLALLGRQLEHAHVSAKLEVAESPPPPPARADRNKVKQVLVNLVLNAMQAQARGGSVTVRVEPCGESRVAVEVIDCGPGLADEELEKIFAPFYTTKQSGAGLGLAVSRSIAAEHDGSLTCRNAGGDGGDGGGAVFRLELEAWKE
jgi:signal transduction histidine kinase